MKGSSQRTGGFLAKGLRQWAALEFDGSTETPMCPHQRAETFAELISGHLLQRFVLAKGVNGMTCLAES